MKKEYVRPSMAMNLFENADSTNAITTASSVAIGSLARKTDRVGVTVINGSKLNS